MAEPDDTADDDAMVDDPPETVAQLPNTTSEGNGTTGTDPAADNTNDAGHNQ